MNRATGFTLIELMVTLVLVGILIAAGVPGMRTLLNNMEARGNADQLAAAFAFARQEAVSNATAVTICSSTDLATCDGGDNDWNQGWIIALGEASALGDILRVGDIGGSTFVVGGSADDVTFDPFGESTSDTPQTFTVCSYDRNTSAARVISVNRTGSVSIDQGATSCPS